MRILLAVMFAVTAMIQPAHADKRIALIVGNQTYTDPHWPALANPANDAKAMERALKEAGFETVTVLNAKRRDFYRAVDEFSSKIAADPNAVGLFYYAGHGVQANGVNYLIPVDAEIEDGSDLEANAFDASRVLQAMKGAQNQMNMVILDACRDNPLPKARGATRGLARMDAPSGTFVAYAAAPGQEARDGVNGANGVFTGELVKAIEEPGVPLEQMFKKVIAGVKSDTHGAQEPWSEASIQGEFYFHVSVTPGPVVAAPVPSVIAPPPGVDPKQFDLTFWESIKDSKDPADFQDYLKQYPQGAFASLAQRKITLLKKPVAPAAPAQEVAPTPAPAAVTPQAPPITGNSGANQQAPRQAGDPLQGVWQGQYRCLQGDTGVELVMPEVAQNGTIRGALRFYPLPGHNNSATGAFFFFGRFDSATGILRTEPGAWISQPPGYVSVGFTVKLDTERHRLTGLINSPACTAIAVDWISRGGR